MNPDSAEPECNEQVTYTDEVWKRPVTDNTTQSWTSVCCQGFRLPGDPLRGYDVDPCVDRIQFVSADPNHPDRNLTNIVGTLCQSATVNCGCGYPYRITDFATAGCHLLSCKSTLYPAKPCGAATQATTNKTSASTVASTLTSLVTNYTSTIVNNTTVSDTTTRTAQTTLASADFTFPSAKPSVHYPDPITRGTDSWTSTVGHMTTSMPANEWCSEGYLCQWGNQDVLSWVLLAVTIVAALLSAPAVIKAIFRVLQTYRSIRATLHDGGDGWWYMTDDSTNGLRQVLIQATSLIVETVDKKPFLVTSPNGIEVAHETGAQVIAGPGDKIHQVPGSETIWFYAPDQKDRDTGSPETYVGHFVKHPDPSICTCPDVQEDLKQRMYENMANRFSDVITHYNGPDWFSDDGVNLIGDMDIKSIRLRKGDVHRGKPVVTRKLTSLPIMTFSMIRTSISAVMDLAMVTAVKLTSEVVFRPVEAWGGAITAHLDTWLVPLILVALLRKSKFLTLLAFAQPAAAYFDTRYIGDSNLDMVNLANNIGLGILITILSFNILMALWGIVQDRKTVSPLNQEQVARSMMSSGTRQPFMEVRSWKEGWRFLIGLLGAMLLLIGTCLASLTPGPAGGLSVYSWVLVVVAILQVPLFGALVVTTTRNRRLVPKLTPGKAPFLSMLQYLMMNRVVRYVLVVVMIMVIYAKIVSAGITSTQTGGWLPFLFVLPLGFLPKRLCGLALLIVGVSGVFLAKPLVTKECHPDYVRMNIFTEDYNFTQILADYRAMEQASRQLLAISHGCPTGTVDFELGIASRAQWDKWVANGDAKPTKFACLSDRVDYNGAWRSQDEACLPQRGSIEYTVDPSDPVYYSQACANCTISEYPLYNPSSVPWVSCNGNIKRPGRRWTAHTISSGTMNRLNNFKADLMIESARVKRQVFFAAFAAFSATAGLSATTFTLCTHDRFECLTVKDLKDWMAAQQAINDQNVILWRIQAQWNYDTLDLIQTSDQILLDRVNALYNQMEGSALAQSVALGIESIVSSYEDTKQILDILAASTSAYNPASHLRAWKRTLQRGGDIRATAVEDQYDFRSTGFQVTVDGDTIQTVLLVPTCDGGVNIDVVRIVTTMSQTSRANGTCTMVGPALHGELRTDGAQVWRSVDSPIVKCTGYVNLIQCLFWGATLSDIDPQTTNLLTALRTSVDQMAFPNEYFKMNSIPCTDHKTCQVVLDSQTGGPCMISRGQCAYTICAIKGGQCRTVLATGTEGSPVLNCPTITEASVVRNKDDRYYIQRPILVKAEMFTVPRIVTEVPDGYYLGGGSLAALDPVIGTIQKRIAADNEKLEEAIDELERLTQAQKEFNDWSSGISPSWGFGLGLTAILLVVGAIAVLYFMRRKGTQTAPATVLTH